SSSAAVTGSPNRLSHGGVKREGRLRKVAHSVTKGKCEKTYKLSQPVAAARRVCTGGTGRGTRIRGSGHSTAAHRPTAPPGVPMPTLGQSGERGGLPGDGGTPLRRRPRRRGAQRHTTTDENQE